MRFQYIIEKETRKICIEVEIYINHSDVKYMVVDVGIKEKGKRKFDFLSPKITNRHEYRKRNADEREEYVKEIFLRYASVADIEAAVDYAYSKIKPDFGKITYRVF